MIIKPGDNGGLDQKAKFVGMLVSSIDTILVKIKELEDRIKDIELEVGTDEEFDELRKSRLENIGDND